MSFTFTGFIRHTVSARPGATPPAAPLVMAIRPDNAPLAKAAALRLAAQQRAGKISPAQFENLFQSRVINIQPYRFVGYLRQPVIKRGDQSMLVDKDGAAIGWSADGDSFVIATAENEAAAAQTLAGE